MPSTFAAQLTVVEQPKDFNSYSLRATNGAIYRDVFAFQCSFGVEPFSIMPTITWEQCNNDGSFSPIMEATKTVPAPGQTTTDDIVIPTHIFFQTNGTNSTGYLQIHDTNNSAYLNARYRCKASSNIAQDTQAPIYSDCAQIIHHSYAACEFTYMVYAHSYIVVMSTVAAMVPCTCILSSCIATHRS